MARRTFFSFHYKPDNARAAQVRNMGMVEGNQPVADNDWETVTRGGDAAIKKWIAEQMRGRSCTVVLVGSNTAGRKWIKYEIIKSWDDGMGLVGIHVNGLKDLNGDISPRGPNPFDVVLDDNTERNLSSIVKCYTPAGATSRQRYDWISKNLAAAVEEAIEIRQAN